MGCPPPEMYHNGRTPQEEGGCPPPPPAPPPFQTKVTIVEKTEIGKILSGYFWYTNFWVRDPPSPPFPPSNTSFPNPLFIGCQ